MKNGLLFLSSFVFLALNNNCKKESNANKVIVTDSTNMINNWKVAFNINSQYSYSIRPIITPSNDVIMSSWGASPREVFRLYDFKTGKVKWEWSDYLRDEQIFTGNRNAIYNFSLILCKNNATYSLNMTSGTTQWKHWIDTMYGSPFIYTGFSGYIYHGFTGEIGRNTFYMFRTKHDKQDWKLIFTYFDSTLVYDKLSDGSVGFTKNTNGDELLIFSLICAGKNVGPTLLCAYNLTKNKYEWTKSYIHKYSYFSVNKIIISEGRIFSFAELGNKYYISSFNVSDGSLVWETTLPDFGVAMHEYQNKIMILCNGDQPVTCYDKSSGQIIWKQHVALDGGEFLNYGFNDSGMFKNYLFSTQGKCLLVFDVNDGKVVYNKKLMSPGHSMTTGIAVNETLGYYYVADNQFANCFKLPPEVKY